MHKIPLKPEECGNHTITCSIATKLISRISKILKEKPYYFDNIINPEPDRLPNFCVVAIESLISSKELDKSVDHFLTLGIDGFLDFLAELAQDNTESFISLVSKIFIFYGYEEEFMNEV